MRLFSAIADCDFNFKSFNEGEYIQAVMEGNKAERKYSLDNSPYSPSEYMYHLCALSE